MVVSFTTTGYSHYHYVSRFFIYLVDYPIDPCYPNAKVRSIYHMAEPFRSGVIS